MSILKLKSHNYITLLLASSLFLADHASAAITFVSGTNSANLVETVDDNGNSVFVIDGIADGDSTDLTFTTDSECPGVAMVGGAEFASNWSCEAGTITASVTYRGGMSFGPGPEEITSFYITFSDPPAPPGSDTVPTELSGIQIAVFGDVSQWDLSGGTTSAGATFGVELSGPKGGDARAQADAPTQSILHPHHLLDHRPRARLLAHLEHPLGDPLNHVPRDRGRRGLLKTCLSTTRRGVWCAQRAAFDRFSMLIGGQRAGAHCWFALQNCP